MWGRVTGVTDDPGRASSGVPHTITKEASSSIGVNKETVAMQCHKGGGTIRMRVR